jgi:hypothetical protein
MREAFDREHLKRLQEEAKVKQLDEQIIKLRQLLPADALANDSS